MTRSHCKLLVNVARLIFLEIVLIPIPKINKESFGGKDQPNAKIVPVVVVEFLDLFYFLAEQ